MENKNPALLNKATQQLTNTNKAAKAAVTFVGVGAAITAAGVATKKLTEALKKIKKAKK